MTETAPFGDFSMISCKDKHHESSSIYFKSPIGSFKHEHSYGGDSRGVKGGRKLNCIKRKSSDSPLFISNMAFQKDILRDASWHTLHRRQIPFRALHRQHCTILLQHTFQLLQKMPKCFFWTRETGAQISQGSQHPPTDTLNSCITDSITWAEIGLCPSLMCRCAQSGKGTKYPAFPAPSL